MKDYNEENHTVKETRLKEMNHQFQTDENTLILPFSNLSPPPRFQTNRYERWSEEEHRLFLTGLKINKKGEWTNIARYVVKTRTPSQVASHAQKYYKHLALANKGKRKSIYDVKLSENQNVAIQEQVDVIPDQVHVQNDDAVFADLEDLGAIW